jgi:hypothetical protein
MDHLVDSHINKLAEALIRVIQAKAKDIDGVVLSHEDATKVALGVIKGVKQ